MPRLSPTPRHGLAQGDAYILDAVMGVDMQIPFGSDLQIDHAVPRNLVQHMVEKGRPVASFAEPLPSRFRLTLIWVSLVLRVTRQYA